MRLTSYVLSAVPENYLAFMVRYMMAKCYLQQFKQ